MTDITDKLTIDSLLKSRSEDVESAHAAIGLAEVSRLKVAIFCQKKAVDGSKP